MLLKRFVFDGWDVFVFLLIFLLSFSILCFDIIVIVGDHGVSHFLWGHIIEVREVVLVIEFFLLRRIIDRLLSWL